MRDEETDVTYTTTQLVSALDADTSPSKASLVDKVVEVSGRIVSIETEKQTMYVFLHKGDYEIQCTLQNSENERVKNLKEGDSVLLKTKFDGYLEDDMFGKQVKMSNGILVKKY